MIFEVVVVGVVGRGVTPNRDVKSVDSKLTRTGVWGAGEVLRVG